MNQRLASDQVLTNAKGLDAIAVVSRIVRAHPEIAKVFLGRLASDSPFQKEHKLSSQDFRIVERIQKQWRHKNNNLPFRDTLVLSLLQARTASEGILRGIKYHQSISKMRFAVASRMLSVQRIIKLADQLSPNNVLVFCSDVRLKNGATRHIPMMDFSCSPADDCLPLVCRVIKLFGVGPGFVVETERSYHFYGIRLLRTRELMKYLGRALLFSPIVDRAWIAHQLMDTRCNVRISSRGKRGKVLRVVDVVT